MHSVDFCGTSEWVLERGLSCSELLAGAVLGGTPSQFRASCRIGDGRRAKVAGDYTRRLERGTPLRMALGWMRTKSLIP